MAFRFPVLEKKPGIIALLFLLLPLPLLAATTVRPNGDAEYRTCMQDAVNTRDGVILPVLQSYHAEWQAAVEEHRQRVVDAWGNEDDRASRDAIRDADRAQRDRLQVAQRQSDAAQREANTAYRDAENSCRDALRARQDDLRRRQRDLEHSLRERRDLGEGEQCLGSGQCGTGLSCSTSRGDCDAVCDGDACIQSCAGRCVAR